MEDRADSDPRGGIIASCGHRLRDDEHSVSVRYKGVSCDAVDGFSNCVIYAEYCPKCAAELEMQEHFLRNDAEADAWLDDPAV